MDNKFLSLMTMMVCVVAFQVAPAAAAWTLVDSGEYKDCNYQYNVYYKTWKYNDTYFKSKIAAFDKGKQIMATVTYLKRTKIPDLPMYTLKVTNKTWTPSSGTVYSSQSITPSTSSVRYYYYKTLKPAWYEWLCV